MSLPGQSKSTRKGQYLFLNGRWIQDRSLQHALTEAYRGLMMVGRHPVAFLFLEVPPDDVDVNVHPTKTEVRFRDSQQLYRLLLSTLRTKFLSVDLESEMQISSQKSEPTAVDSEQQQAVQQELVNWAASEIANFIPVESIGTRHARPSLDFEADSTPAAASVASYPSQNREFKPYPDDFRTLPAAVPGDQAPSNQAPSNQAQHQPTAAAEQTTQPTSGYSTIHRALQVLDCYLVVETDEGLTIIDQHALHERIMYERLRSRILNGKVESQKMLVLETIEMSPKEIALLLDNKEVMQQLGFGIEEFGKGTLLLNAYPALLQRADHVALVRDIADQLDRPGQKPSSSDILESLLQMMSCKAAIKAGYRLATEEIDSLLAQRHLVDNTHHCPHGRPTALTLSRDELDKQFGRLGHV